MTGWNTVIGQERAVGTLQAALRSGRVAHAYLFHGPDGVGKRAAALAFAQSLLCTAAEPPCGACPACHKSMRLIHPDLHFLMAQPADTKPEAIQERVARLVEEPYATIDFVRRGDLDAPGTSSGKQVQYSVSRINDELRRVVSFRPVEGSYKIAILTDADLLRKEAANAFLKLLEEPSDRTVFILISGRPDRMLPTILSRCQHVRFDRLTAPEIARALQERRELDAAIAGTLSRMADGSYGRALDLADSEELLEARAEVLAFLRGAFRAWAASDRIANQIEQLSRNGREYVKFVLELMLGWVRDIALLRSLGPDAPVVNTDQADEIARFAASLPDADPAVMAELIEDCIEKVDRNVHIRLLLTVLAQKLAGAMRGQRHEALVEPLTDGV